MCTQEHINRCYGQLFIISPVDTVIKCLRVTESDSSRGSNKLKPEAKKIIVGVKNEEDGKKLVGTPTGICRLPDGETCLVVLCKDGSSFNIPSTSRVRWRFRHSKT